LTTLKFLVTITLAALVAASGVTAQDTLLLRTFRTVDVCSSEQRWLIAPYIGNIRSTDSLASFDITIGFDTSVVRPTDVLTENTLSFMSDYPAQMSLVIPGEMRIAGFNIIRNMVGDKPLFAVAGNYAGGCGDSIKFTFPWPPSFNEEFKKKVTVLASEHVAVVANPGVDQQLGVTFTTDSMSISGRDSVGVVKCSVAFGSKRPRTGTLFIKLSDDDVATIDSASVEGAQLVALRTTTKSVEVDVAFENGRAPQMSIYVRNTTSASSARVSVEAYLDVTDSCACVRSGLRDTVGVELTNPIVSVSSPVDDSNEKLVVTSTTASCYCNHGQTNEINVFSLTGVRIDSRRTNEVENTMSIDHLPSGAYIIVGTCGTRTLVNLNMK
jgi:hypothetical protein